MSNFKHQAVRWFIQNAILVEKEATISTTDLQVFFGHHSDRDNNSINICC